MAKNTIKGITVEIGGDTTQLGKALEDVNNKSRDLSSELGEINKLLKFDPGNADLLAQKQKVLSDAVENTAEKLETLKEAEKQVQKQFEKGEASEEQVRALQREIVETTNKMRSYENAARETADAIDKLGDESDQAANEVQDFSKSEEDAEENADKLGGTLGGSLSTGLTAVIGLATAAAAAVIGTVEATQEYRTAMGKLNTAFASTEKSTESATKTYKAFQRILGDTDQAVEAASHLAELVDDEKDLNKWTKVCTGVYAKFGDSLPIEGLTEAANETAKTGSLTGALADALNWAGESEDDFQAKLDECTDEQERQSLILETLNGLYSDAAEEYEKANKAVIEANEANEEWNATLAEIGEEMQPVVTSIKELGTELLQNAKEPLKDIADFIMDKALPAVESMSDWAKENKDVIAQAFVTAGAVLVTYKTAVLATTIAQEGLKGAIMATTIAEKALQLVQNASPWGLVATAIAGVVGALGLYIAATNDSKTATDVLTEEERELMEAADKTAQAFREQKAATDETASSITSQMGHIQSLANELDTLATESGRVKIADQERAEYILNELNEALGTEYTMTDGLIQNYRGLQEEVYKLIQAKTANSLLEARNADYIAAIDAEAEALANMGLKQKELEAAKEHYAQREAEINRQIDDVRKQLNDSDANLSSQRRERLETQYHMLKGALELEQDIVKGKEEAWQESAAVYGEYHNTILDYEEAQSAVLQENYDRAVDILSKKGGNFAEYADNVDQSTRDAIDALYKEAIDAGLAAERTKQNFEAGIEGYTKEMVDEAAKGYEEALDAWATARTDAESVGEDLSGGLADGMENQKSSLIEKAKSIVNSIIDAFREAADSNSPSKKMIAFGEDMGEGAAIGMEDKTKRLDEVAREQVDHLLDTYTDAGDVSGQSVFNNIQDRNAEMYRANSQAAANSTTVWLDRILSAIEHGQIITIDGDALVGATAGRMDSTLGQRRELVARGAI